MNLAFAKHPLYVAIQFVVGLAMIGGGLASGYASLQRERCAVATDDLQAKVQARLNALETRAANLRAREASLEARDPELAKKLRAPQSGAN